MPGNLHRGGRGDSESLPAAGRGRLNWPSLALPEPLSVISQLVALLCAEMPARSSLCLFAIRGVPASR
jgi:hypothetical protein